MLSEKQEWLSQAADNQQVTSEQLDSLLQQAELFETLERYQLAGAVLRNEADSVLPADFSANFAALLAEETTYDLKSNTSFTQRIKLSLRQAANAEWFKPAAHGAIAASVALVAIFGVQQYQQPLDSTIAMPSPVLQTSRDLATFATPVSLSQTSVQSRFEEQEQQALQEQQRRLQTLLQAHRHQVRLMDSQPAQIVEPTTQQEKREH